MAAQTFKLAITNASFPFLFSRTGRSVVQPGLDVAPRTSVAFVGGVESFDYNLIKVIYCENVLPAAEGIQSVALLSDFAAYTPAVTDFDQLMTLRDSDERNYSFSPARGKNYVLDNATGAWTSYNSFVWGAQYKIVSRAYVNGRTIIGYEANRLIEWDPIGVAFNTLTLTLPIGYAITDIRMCSGASNYLLLATETEILWSSLLVLENFADTNGGAGKQTPVDLKGKITALVPISGGFVIYTERNAVAAFFTNNAATPFSFREIQGSGGVAGYEQVTGDANQAEHYCYGSSGIQVLNLQQAVSILPDCTDFLTTREYESWNSVTAQIETTAVVGPLKVKLQLLGNRYLFISYGTRLTQFTFSLVYDLVLKRWGKLRCDHVDIGILPAAALEGLGFRYFELSGPYEEYNLEYENLNATYGDILPLRAGFVFLQETGALQTIFSDPAGSEGNGLVIIGRVQITRGRMVTFQGVKFDGLRGDSNPVVKILGSLPGDGYDRTAPYIPQIHRTTDNMVDYAGRKTYENFDIAVEGKFLLTAAIVRTTIHGSR